MLYFWCLFQQNAALANSTLALIIDKFLLCFRFDCELVKGIGEYVRVKFIL